MLTDALVIARKECRDHLRDGRGLLSAALYTFMGPAVTALVAVASRDRAGQNALAAMAAVFAVMSAFTGGLGIAIDVMAGERERQSLLPLLLNPSSRGAIAAGKWLAAAAFAFVALLLNVAVFLAVLSHAHTIDAQTLARVALAIGPLAALAGLAAALELVISTLSATTKEANAYTSIVTFLVMGLCMWRAFRPATGGMTPLVLPIAGQQAMLARLFDLVSTPPGAPWILSAATLTLAAGLVAMASRLLASDRVVYGG